MFVMTSNLPCGEWTLRFIGRLEIPLLEPVTRSVSSSISFWISLKLINFLPLAWRNSPYSVGPLISWRIKGRRVTMPLPRGRKSLKKIEKKIIPSWKMWPSRTRRRIFAAIVLLHCVLHSSTASTRSIKVSWLTRMDGLICCILMLS